MIELSKGPNPTVRDFIKYSQRGVRAIQSWVGPKKLLINSKSGSSNEPAMDLCLRQATRPVLTRISWIM